MIFNAEIQFHMNTLKKIHDDNFPLASTIKIFITCSWHSKEHIQILLKQVLQIGYYLNRNNNIYTSMQIEKLGFYQTFM